MAEHSVPPAFSPGRIVATLNYGAAPQVPLRDDLIDNVSKNTLIESVGGTYLVRVTVSWDIVRRAHRMEQPQQDAGRTRRHAILDPIIATFDDQLKAINKAIATLVAGAALAERARILQHILQAIPGIGATTAHSLLVLIPPQPFQRCCASPEPWAAPPELGSLSLRQAASLAGLALHPRQSGNRDAYRRIRGGRPIVRQTLFMAALAASRSNAQLKTFYPRLITNDKKPRVAITPTMRKLITIANAKLRDAKKMQLG